MRIQVSKPAPPAPTSSAPPSAPARAEGGRRSRRRGATLEDALLRAAWEELSAVGYANLTMEGVAVRAGTSKAVLYRRWPNRAELALAAHRDHARAVHPDHMGSVADQIPDTGDLREDVMAVLRHLRRSSEEMSPDTLHGLLAELRTMPPDLMEVLPGVMMTILRRAAERGEVDLGKVTPRIAALPGDLLRHQFLITGRSVSDDFLSEIVDEIFLPLVVGPSRRTSRRARG
jgi:AcrR family transcriptional regulator